MIVAIHHRDQGFSKRWIEYCYKQNIPYRLVNAYETDIIEQVKGCKIFLWHHHHAKYSDAITAKRILFALEHAGVQVFPDFKTGWHFDDKVAQKYLLEAIGAPVVKSYVFYEKNRALAWAKTAEYPTVFKLKGGAGSANVKLVKNYGQAKFLIKKSFANGFPQFDKIQNFKDRFEAWKLGKESFSAVLKGLARFFFGTEFTRLQPNEKGYVYFQEFLPNNDHDLRVIVIGERAFAIKRMVREGDFRASGSGNICYDKNEIDIAAVKIAFDINKKLRSQSVAYDFVYNKEKELKIIELSYGYAVEAYDNCPGYWDSSLNWHQEKFIPQEWMISELLNGV